MDLVLELGGRNGRWAVEVKRGLTPKISKGLLNAQADLRADCTFVVYSGSDNYALADGIEVIGLAGLAARLRAH